jgi:hypothetical protein
MAKRRKDEIVVIPTELPVGTLFRFSDSETVYKVKKTRSKSGSICEKCAFGDFECLLGRLPNCMNGKDALYFEEAKE